MCIRDRGYVSGVGDGKFAPDASVTREQMALILSLIHIYSYPQTNIP